MKLKSINAMIIFLGTPLKVRLWYRENFPRNGKSEEACNEIIDNCAKDIQCSLISGKKNHQ